MESLRPSRDAGSFKAVHRRGRDTATVVPASELFSTHTVPPWSLTISPHQRKPQAHAAVFPAAGLVHPEEGLKNAPLKAFRDAGAGVGHPDQQLFGFRRDGKGAQSRRGRLYLMAFSVRLNSKR